MCLSLRWQTKTLLQDFTAFISLKCSWNICLVSWLATVPHVDNHSHCGSLESHSGFKNLYQLVSMNNFVI